ncbi:MAG: hypothetical protein H0U57_06815 [Tatlockia sp.]|nr:hypothetical protein [Tatlockia sp.]
MLEIVTGYNDPILVIKTLKTIIDFYNLPCKKHLGDSHGLEEMIGLYYAHDDLDQISDVSFNDKFGKKGIFELKEQNDKDSKKLVRKL